MAKHQDLCFQRVSRSEKSDQPAPDQPAELVHRAEDSADSLPRANPIRFATGTGLSPLATAVGASIVDPWVSQIVNPENLAQLLRGGTVSSELGPVSFRFGNLPSTLNLAWDAWLSSEYGFGRFSIWLPPGASQANQFRFRMQLLQWHWKVTGIDLPEKLRDQIAGELAKKYP
jgi:hypothetical protein